MHNSEQKESKWTVWKIRHLRGQMWRYKANKLIRVKLSREEGENKCQREWSGRRREIMGKIKKPFLSQGRANQVRGKFRGLLWHKKGNKSKNREAKKSK